MIIGIGVDLCDNRRIARVALRFPSRFAKRICTINEQKHLATTRKERYTRRLSGYFAAKEAIAKALGTGVKFGVAWRDMEVTRDHKGRPSFQLHHGAKRRLGAMLPPGKRATCHLSLSHESNMTTAIAIIEV